MRKVSISGFLVAVGLSVAAAPALAMADLFVVDHPFNSDVVDLFDNSGAPVSAGGPTFVSLLFATGVAVGPDGSVYVDTDDPQQLGMPPAGPDGSVFRYGYNPATGNVTSTSLFVQYDGTPTSVFVPQGMKFGANGELYIADEGNNGTVHLYNSSGASDTTYSPTGNPTAVAFSPAGNLYAADGVGVDELDPVTKTFSQIVTAETGGPENPEDVAFGQDGKLYVLDTSSAAPIVWQYNADGSGQSIFINFSSSATQPDFQPSNFVFGPDGLLYVTGLNQDTNVGEIMRYNTNGSFDDVFVTGLSNPGFLAFTSVPEPTGLAALAGVALLGKRRRRA